MKRVLLFVMILSSIAQLTNAQIWADNFDDGDISDWTLNDIDGDGNNWLTGEAGVDGSGCIISESFQNGVGPLTPNNYITSPGIDLRDQTGAVALDWKAYAQDQAWPQEKYKVVISEAPLVAAIDIAEIVFEETLFAMGNQVWFERTVDISQYAGKTIYITFIHFESTDWFRLNVDDVQVYIPASDDAGIAGIVSPGSDAGCTFTDAETATVTLFNFGGNDISNFEVSYAINGGTPVVEIVDEVIGAASSFDYTFNTPFDASALGDYTIEFATSLDGDSDASNDIASQSFTHSDAVMTVHVMTDVSSGHSWAVIDNISGDTVATHAAYAWEQEFFDDVCIFSDRCYSFVYPGPDMDAGAFLEILIDGVQVAGDTEGNGVVAGIDIPALGGGCAANEASLIGLTTNKYYEINSSATVTGIVRNFGSDPINTLEMSYAVDGGAPVVETFDGLNVSTGSSFDFTFGTPVSIADLTEYDVDVNIITVNGETDSESSNNSASTELIAISFVPEKAVLAEEATGTWCQFCPRGAVLMDMMTEEYGKDFIGIAVHNGDPMAFATYDTPFSSLISFSYPSIVLDRVNLDADPGNLALVQLMRDDINERLNTIAPLTIDVDVNYTGDGNMTIDVSSEFVAPVSGDIRYNVVVTEDGVTGTNNGYDQVNIYSGGALGPMAGYENLPNPVPASMMVYDHVARAILGGFNGAANSVPSSNARGDKTTYTFNYQITDISKLPNMHVIAMAIDQSNGEVLNATSTNLFTTDVEDILYDESKVNVFPNPASDQSFIEISLENSNEVELSVINSYGQLVDHRNYGEQIGNLVFPYHTAHLTGGIYYLNLRIGEKIVTKKLVITK